MKVTLIGCPFQTSYGIASDSLKKALEKKTGTSVEWVASNCGCHDDFEVNRLFQMPKGNYKYFDMLTWSEHPSPQAWKRWAKYAAGKIVYYVRARKFRRLSAGAEVVNFQQTLNAYGSTALFYWLNQRSQAARVVTVHELDRFQLANPESNKIYNKADAIIVQQNGTKDQLIGFGVDPNKIELVCNGTDLPTINANQAREGIICYGGHHPLKNKGLEAIFKAVALLRTRLGPQAPKLKVHGYFSGDTLTAVKALAAESGLKDVAWLTQISMPEIFHHYRASQFCVLPYMGSFAGLAAATAAAVELPVIATRNAGIPEHIGENGIWIDKDDAEQIATQVERLMGSEELRRDLGGRLRKRAEQFLTWDIIADQTLAVYNQAIRRKMKSHDGPVVPPPQNPDPKATRNDRQHQLVSH